MNEMKSNERERMEIIEMKSNDRERMERMSNDCERREWKGMRGGAMTVREENGKE